MILCHNEEGVNGAIIGQQRGDTCCEEHYPLPLPHPSSNMAVSSSLAEWEFRSINGSLADTPVPPTHQNNYSNERSAASTLSAETSEKHLR